MKRGIQLLVVVIVVLAIGVSVGIVAGNSWFDKEVLGGPGDCGPVDDCIKHIQGSDCILDSSCEWVKQTYCYQKTDCPAKETFFSDCPAGDRNCIIGKCLTGDSVCEFYSVGYCDGHADCEKEEAQSWGTCLGIPFCIWNPTGYCTGPGNCEFQLKENCIGECKWNSPEGCRNLYDNMCDAAGADETTCTGVGEVLGLPDLCKWMDISYCKKK